MKSMLISQARLLVAMATVAVVLVGCSGSSDKGMAHLAQMAAEEETARARQALADTQFNSAVANAMEKIVAPGQRFGADMESTSGLLLPGSDASSGSAEVITSQSSRDGGYVTSSLPWRNDDGNLEFYVEITPYLQSDPDVSSTRYVDTSYRQGEFDGFTQSYSPIANHGLGAEWQGFTATNRYNGGGSLTVNFHTDADASDSLGRPWVNDVLQRPDARHEIVLNDVPPLPASRDWRSVSLTPDGLAGSLNGIVGRFACPSGTECSLDNERLSPDWEGYHAGYDGSNLVIFTPADGGMPVHLSGSDSQAVPPGNYLSFGNWLYVPADATDTDGFELGVFAAGREPFAEDNLMALTGTATYAGKAAGIYTAAAFPATHSFSAQVGLVADFGTGSEFGTLDGWVSDFVLDGGEPAALTRLHLQLPAAPAPSNIHRLSPYDDTPLPGGWVTGNTVADGGWQGVWGGRFFGNGATPTGHPNSFAGTFGATDGNRSVAGSFGTHRTGSNR